MSKIDSSIFAADVLRRPKDLQNLFVDLLKGGLDKRSRDGVGRAAARYVDRIIGQPYLNQAFPQVTDDERRTIKTLQKIGYAYIPNVFSDADIETIKNFCENEPGYTEAGHHETYLRRDVPPHVKFLHYEPAFFCRCPPIYRVLHDEHLIATVARYLGAPPTIGITSTWWSFPVPGDPELKTSGMQLFHHDRGDFRSCNLFVYLTDVTETTGPHAFVDRTHSFDVLFNTIAQRLGNDPAKFTEFWNWMENHRKTDEEIYRHFPANEVKIHTGPKGTSFLEDTCGLHKGTRPRTAPRFAFEIFFSVMPKMNEKIVPVSRSELSFPDLETNSDKLNPLVRFATRQYYA